MATAPSSLDLEAMARARTLMEPPVRKDLMWPVIAAAAVMALAAISFATAMVLAPPVVTEHVAQGVE